MLAEMGGDRLRVVLGCHLARLRCDMLGTDES